jgi:hypothetical protein
VEEKMTEPNSEPQAQEPNEESKVEELREPTAEEKAAEEEQKKIDEAQLKYDRMVSKDKIKLNIKGINRENQFKRTEIAKNQVTEKDERWTDGKKPLWLIQHEIDVNEMKKKHFEYQLKELEEADAKTS